MHVRSSLLHGRGQCCLAVAVSTGLGAAVWASRQVHPNPTLHEVALFAHLASLVLGFGAVLSIDWVGLMWALGRRRLPDVLATAHNLQPPIWIGLAALVASGAFLEPDVGRPLVQLKLAFVLGITWNGLLAGHLHRRFTKHQLVEGPLIAMSTFSVVASQIGWWGATLIGFVNH